MAEVDGRFVKLGFWTNLEQTRSWEVQLPPPLEQELSSSLSWLSCRPSLGNQLRLHATYLLRTGTSHLWNLFTFAYHQVRATGRPSDGLFRHQQATLRTRPSPSSLMADSAKLWWLWKKRSDRVLLRSLPQFLLAFLCAVGSIAASISSSYVVSSSELKVLVSSPSCGHVNSSQPINALRAQSDAIRSVAAPYAQECYHDSTLLPTRCQAFVRPYIPFTSQKVACPFNTIFCVR
jgi:hypothetical protein